MRRPPEAATGRTRVLALVHLPPPVHGVSLVNRRLVEGPVSDAVDLRVVPLRFARSIGDLGRPGLRKALRAVWVGLRQLEMLLFGRIDVGYITPATHGAALVRDALYMHLFRVVGTPYVAHVHTMGLKDAVESLRPWLGRVVVGAFRGAARIIALNRAHRRELAGVVAADEIDVVPNALPDLGTAAGGTADGAPTSRFGGDAARLRILFLSNMVIEKGAGVLVDALPRVRAVARDVRPTFAGAWPDGRARSTFMRRAAEHGVDDWIDVRGAVDEDAKRRLLDDALVLAFPSYYAYECAPLVILEAMRQAVAVVATRHAGIPELVEHGVTGLLVPPRDADALADALISLVEDRERAVRYGTAGRLRFEAAHLQGDWNATILRVLREAASSPPTSVTHPR